MTYAQAVTALERLTVRAVKPGLERTRLLLERLNRPDLDFPIIQITGSNGKGSVAALLSSILHCAGYRVGRYTSPHLADERERITVAGSMISRRAFARAMQILLPELRRLRRSGHPATRFEAWTVLAAEAFHRAGVALAVVEVGMGGRLDATTALDRACLSVLTHTELEHTRELGRTREAILREKLGILRPGVPLVSAESRPGLRRRIVAAAKRQGSEILFAGHEKNDACRIVETRFQPGQTAVRLMVENRLWPWLPVPLAGAFQAANIALAVLAAQALSRQGYRVTEKSIRHGLAAVAWPGRMERIGHRPNVILDGAHNPAAAHALAQTLGPWPGRIFLIAGVMADKNYPAMVQALSPVASQAWTVTPPDPRGLAASRLAASLTRAGVPAAPAGSYCEAMQHALSAATAQDTVLVAGSLYNIEPARRAFTQVGRR